FLEDGGGTGRDRWEGGEGGHVRVRGGDIDGDGYDDILVTGNYTSQDYSRSSSGAQVYRGYPMANYVGILLLTLDAQDTDPGTEASIASVASAGDIDGDGAPDVALGMYMDSGAARIKLHSSAAWTPAADTISAPAGNPSFSRELVGGGP
ncbi:MAG TPA: hypothetical protein VL172_16500, partial [Kofleriaceae bacterium]|nr:hypothetical protein [Kofleriaceae bacterium]